MSGAGFPVPPTRKRASAPKVRTVELDYHVAMNVGFMPALVAYLTQQSDGAKVGTHGVRITLTGAAADITPGVQRLMVEQAEAFKAGWFAAYAAHGIPGDG